MDTTQVDPNKDRIILCMDKARKLYQSETDPDKKKTLAFIIMRLRDVYNYYPPSEPIKLVVK